ncbi:hypothetical protein VIBNIAM115_340005 [Vibrio nigripulchritudo AM115]|nr:hypothetical protein VIBNIAM115_340005 [Vibrio nigripulchritudo AM115]
MFHESLNLNFVLTATLNIFTPIVAMVLLAEWQVLSGLNKKTLLFS